MHANYSGQKRRRVGDEDLPLSPLERERIVGRLLDGVMSLLRDWTVTDAVEALMEARENAAPPSLDEMVALLGRLRADEASHLEHES